MTVAQLDERLTALEKEVAALRAEVNGQQKGERNGSAAPTTEDDFIDGAECDFVPDVPPIEVIVLKGTLVKVEPGPSDLALSPQEWEALGLEDSDA